MTEPHPVRIQRMIRQFDEAMARFVARLEAAGAAADAPPGDGGWSVAQVAWHVAQVNTAMAGLISGDVKGAVPARPDFAEREWPHVAASVAPKLEAGEPFRPAANTTIAETLPKLRASAELVRGALEALSPERGRGYTFTSPIVGTISVYQIGDWAAAHVIRHNAQAKRLLRS